MNKHRITTVAQVEGSMFKAFWLGYILCVSGLFTAPLIAAPYEVMPVGYDYAGSPVAAHDYYAEVFDNTTGKTYRCAVRFVVGQPLTSGCADNALQAQNTLQPSPDLTTAVQYSPTPSNRGQIPVTGLWQINSTQGDLQFCLAEYANPAQNIAPGGNFCVKVTWRGSSAN